MMNDNGFVEEYEALCKKYGVGIVIGGDDRLVLVEVNFDDRRPDGECATFYSDLEDLFGERFNKKNVDQCPTCHAYAKENTHNAWGECRDDFHTCLDCIGTSATSTYCDVWETDSPLANVKACRYFKPRERNV